MKIYHFIFKNNKIINKIFLLFKKIKIFNANLKHTTILIQLMNA